jgi:hypothetical protein
MTKFNDFFNEAKNVGFIYHFTTLDNAIKILSGTKTSDAVIPALTFISGNKTVSCTRNACLSVDYENSPDVRVDHGYVVRFTIDGTKLSNKYKIKPIKGLTDNSSDVFGKDKERITGDESEEVILGKNFTFDLKDAVVRIDVYNYLYDDIDEDEFINKYKQIKSKAEAMGIKTKLVDDFKVHKNNG